MKRPPMYREYLTYPTLWRHFVRTSRTRGERRVWGSHKDQRYLLHRPEGTPKKTLMVYIHGGGWKSGSPEIFSAIGGQLARRGFVTISPAYRKTPRHVFPAQMEDVAGALRDFLAREPFESVAVIGSSAGGHLGALLCFDAARYGFDPSLFAGFCSLAGALSFDLCQPNRRFERMLHALLPDKALYKEADPLSYVAGREGLHLLGLHGAADPLIFARSAEAFFGRLPPDPAHFQTLHILPGRCHSEVAAGAFYYRDEQRALLEEWLTRFG